MQIQSAVGQLEGGEVINQRGGGGGGGAILIFGPKLRFFSSYKSWKEEGERVRDWLAGRLCKQY